jgi:hypothetical protein
MGYSTYSNTASATAFYDGVPNSSEGEHLWSYIFGGDGNDYSYAVAVDDFSGDVVLTGQFSGMVDFGGGILPCSGSINTVVAKYTADGKHLWSKGIDGGTGRVIGKDVALDSSGNVLVTGTFWGTIDFGGQKLSSNCIGGMDLFVAKYSTDGELLWVDRQGGTVENRGNGITVDSNDNVLVTGFFQNPDDIILAKYSPDGVLLWLERFTGSGNNTGKSVAVDVNNNIFIIGDFYGTVDFGGVPLTSSKLWDPDIFVAKYSTNGVHLWSRRFGSTRDVCGNGIAIDGNGDVVITGGFRGTADFCGQTLNCIGNYDIFMVKLNGVNGQCQWSQRLGDIGFDMSNGVAIDSSDNIVLTGRFDPPVNLGGEVLTGNGYDIFVAKYSENGGHIWSKSFAGSGADTGYSVATNASGELYLSGTTSTPDIDFGGGELTGYGYSYDIFLVKLGP